MRAVVSDSTVLIGLAKIDSLFLLKEMVQEIRIVEVVIFAGATRLKHLSD